MFGAETCLGLPDVQITSTIIKLLQTSSNTEDVTCSFSVVCQQENAELLGLLQYILILQSQVCSRYNDSSLAHYSIISFHDGHVP